MSDDGDNDGDGDDGSNAPAQQPAVTAQSLDSYLSSKKSPMAGQGANFMKWGLQYNLDPRLLVAIAGAESGFGTNLQAGANNPFGLLYNHTDPYHSDYDNWDRAIRGLGKSLTGNNYDLSNTKNMYLGNGSGPGKTKPFAHRAIVRRG